MRPSFPALARADPIRRRQGGWMRSFRFGAPFVLFLIAGSYGMAEVLGLKYERMDQRVVKQSERQYELQQEHKEMMERLSLHDYDLKPIPRPDEGEGDQEPR